MRYNRKKLLKALALYNPFLIRARVSVMVRGRVREDAPVKGLVALPHILSLI